jgi:pentatricopeptide repeat protein
MTNIEEKLQLDIGINACSFLKNIVEYGNNRMARRAIGVIQKMPAYKVYPTEAHYNAGLWACENSLQFQLAFSLYQEMRDFEIAFTESSYEALTSVSERTGHHHECLQFFHEMRGAGLRGSTPIFNNCMWSCDKAGNYTLALELLQLMEAEGISRDEVSYAACITACRSAADGHKALHVLDLMKHEGVSRNTLTLNAAMWACINDEMPREALNIFATLTSDDDDETATADADSYNAAIWASAIEGDSPRAVELLRLMKLAGLKRETKSFDGALLALSKSSASASSSWETLLDVMTWMDRDGLARSSFTYSTAIGALARAGREEEAMQVYVRAVREGLLSPWVKDTRTLDLRGVSLAVARVTMRHILMSMKNRKLSPFDLTILVDQGGDDGDDVSFDVEELKMYVSSLQPVDVLVLSSCREGGELTLRLPRDQILQWMEGWE